MVRGIVLFLSCLLLVCVGSACAAGERADETYVIAGTVYLEGQSDHSGTVVSIEATVVPSMGFWGFFIVLALMTLVILCRKQVKPALVLLCVGVGLYSLGGLVSGSLVVITGSDGTYSLTNPGGELFLSRSYVVRFEHTGYQSQQVQFDLPANAGQTFGLANVTLLPTGGMSAGDLYAVDAIVGNVRYVPATGPAGFVQGSPVDEPCRGSNETQFTHVLTRDLAVMETEVTRRMWIVLKAVQPSLPHDPTNEFYGSGMTNPVNSPTWYEAVLFANLLSVQNGLTRCYYTDAAFSIPIDRTNYRTGPFYCNFDASGYRLFTEGEWEYAARARTTTAFSCNEPEYTSGNCSSCTAGSHPTLEQYAVYCANDNVQSESVGTKLPNPWNLKDMHGNVLEWCWDWYAYTYPGDTTDYAGPESGPYRVVRGGHWYGGAWGCRSAYRDGAAAGGGNRGTGFRLARTVSKHYSSVPTTPSFSSPVFSSLGLS